MAVYINGVEQGDGGAGVDAGLITLWHGTIANIPAGWVICDGNGGTPNLLATFVEGVATALTNPGAGGGAVGKTTAGHTHGLQAGSSIFCITNTDRQLINMTDTITDVRPPFYDVAYLMKT